MSRSGVKVIHQRSRSFTKVKGQPKVKGHKAISKGEFDKSNSAPPPLAMYTFTRN